MRKRLTREALERSRDLRRNATSAERLLWWKLRELNRRGFTFHRQLPVRGYYLDFAERSARLAIELDGERHGTEEQQVHDIERDAALEREGYRVLRFSNAEVFKDLDIVVGFILNEVTKRRGWKAQAPPDQ